MHLGVRGSCRFLPPALLQWELSAGLVPLAARGVGLCCSTPKLPVGAICLLPTWEVRMWPPGLPSPSRPPLILVGVTSCQHARALFLAVPSGKDGGTSPASLFLLVNHRVGSCAQFFPVLIADSAPHSGGVPTFSQDLQAHSIFYQICLLGEMSPRASDLLQPGTRPASKDHRAPSPWASLPPSSRVSPPLSQAPSFLVHPFMLVTQLLWLRVKGAEEASL